MGVGRHTQRERERMTHNHPTSWIKCVLLDSLSSPRDHPHLLELFLLTLQWLVDMLGEAPVFLLNQDFPPVGRGPGHEWYTLLPNPSHTRMDSLQRCDTEATLDSCREGREEGEEK